MYNMRGDSGATFEHETTIISSKYKFAFEKKNIEERESRTLADYMQNSTT